MLFFTLISNYAISIELDINKNHVCFVNNEKKLTSENAQDVLCYAVRYIHNNCIYEYIDMSGEFTLYGFELFIDNSYKNHLYRILQSYDLRIEYDFPDSLNTSQLFIKNVSK